MYIVTVGLNVADRHQRGAQRQIEIFLDLSHRPREGVGRQVAMFSRNSETDPVSAEHEREILMAERVDHRRYRSGTGYIDRLILTLFDRDG